MKKLLLGLWILAACDSQPSPAPVSEAPKPSAAPPASVAAKPPPPPSPAPSPSAIASAPAPAPSGSAAPEPKKSRTVGGASTQVVLLEPGREPRRELRYAYQAGKSERAELRSGTTLSMELGGKKIDLPAMPDLEMKATIDIVELTKNGGARRKIVIDHVSLQKSGIDPSLSGDVETALSRLKGLEGRDLIDSRGFIHELKLERVKADVELRQFLESMQQALGQMGAPFPDEPVGKGARWRIDTKVSQQGLDLRQTATYTLAELDGNKGKATITLQQKAPAGAVNPPGMPKGIKAELLGLESKGNGELTFDLSRMVPTGKVTTQSKIKVRTHVPTGGSQDATMHITARANFKAAK